MAVPEPFHDLFDKRTFAHVATLMPDGTPQSTPVWIDYDSSAEELLFNTVRGRRKERNLREKPAVAVSMTDPDDPYRFLTVRGEVVALEEAGAVEHIHELARRYMDVSEYPNLDDETGARVIARVRPDHVVTS
jgi:PPOX class probable F420-dependent enzyme